MSDTPPFGIVWGAQQILRPPEKGGPADPHRSLRQGSLRQDRADVPRQMLGSPGPSSAGDPDPDQPGNMPKRSQEMPVLSH